jgi:hypothetical protein
MMKHILTVGAAAGALLAIAACQDLNVPNTNDPDRDRALANPADVEALVGSQFLVFFNRLTNRTAVYDPVPLMADEMTGTYANDGALEISSEPRVEFNNNSEGLVFAMSTFPYKEFNSMVASANDVLNAIDDGLIIETPIGVGANATTLADNTFRTQVFSHFIKGLGMGYLSMYFDSAFVVDQEEQRGIADNSLDAKDLEFQPYPEVRDSAIKEMEKAIELALLPSDFELPPLVYFRTVTVDDELLARIAHTYIARFLVYGARTPAERRATDWDRVLTHLNAGITADFILPLNNPLLVAGYLNLIANSGSFSARADYKMIGPADQPGPRLGCPECDANTTAYQKWISKPLAQRTRFDIITPDRRITGATGPQSIGTYFQYRANDVMEPTRGLYHFSAYQWRRNTSSSTGNIIWLSKAEVDLMKAEAYYFKGDSATAATYVNLSRANGGLEAIGEAGDQSADCVPRKTDGTCGGIYDAIVYERTVEGAGQDALRTYFDSRGLDRLPEGTVIQLPISVDEAVALEKPIYTYGGVGRPGSVPKCTRVTITCHPSFP